LEQRVEFDGMTAEFFNDTPQIPVSGNNDEPVPNGSIGDKGIAHLIFPIAVRFTRLVIKLTESPADVFILGVLRLFGPQRCMRCRIRAALLPNCHMSVQTATALTRLLH
jgi:hypothetical protein